jgi:serpin B
MRTSLGFGAAAIAEINQGYRDLIQLLTGLDRTTEMRIANSLWGANGFAMRPQFTDAARTWFDAEVQSLDFHSPAAVGTINDWVKAKTAGRIPKLLDTIRADEVLFLINAIYFKGSWRIPFDRGKTRDAPFTGADGTARQVPMMNLDAMPLRYAATSTYQAVDLLYGNGAFAMTVLLPSSGGTPAGVLAGFDPAAWSALVDQLEERKVALGLPRFRVEYGARLYDALTALGMGVAFDDQRADLSGIADVGSRRLYISRVDQKAFVEVNEEGTEAAAATNVGVGLTSAPPAMIVDRPFLFMIRERFSGTIMFVGIVQRLGA